MKYTLPLVVLFGLVANSTQAQQYLSRNTLMHFYSDAPLEKIEASNPKGITLINIGTGSIESSVLMKGFTFRKALMQEHFNENYVESDKYPKASFKGKILTTPVQLTTPGNYIWKIEGDLTLHGKTNPVKTTATVTVEKLQTKLSCTFYIKLSDYDIAIPSLVKDNVSNTVKIDITINDLKSM